jgi:hypothetical protein
MQDRNDVRLGDFETQYDAHLLRVVWFVPLHAQASSLGSSQIGAISVSATWCGS